MVFHILFKKKIPHTVKSINRNTQFLGEPGFCLGVLQNHQKWAKNTDFLCGALLMPDQNILVLINFSNILNIKKHATQF